ncbi:LAS superfamily LD-carboxypeptidase LdcB [Branchiibius hedensis]|uniref:LD-carboxypeptidase LdcB, LAS superfamily n=1 Tax=Branchiibius hedensis TaxID=672460 RepID=A0A2Y8ZQA9_9MICO|nr:peptidoglycan-binding protein [Branchiibius hedensis]PWJ25727.1 LAS superfamily LD-carboxypeptidase LdcB [Branchiibius hedensis]SSA34540.1 LD-carboxypeptidase LdcB, LAS superfamily [Branchiibius hedensis]
MNFTKNPPATGRHRAVGSVATKQRVGRGAVAVLGLTGIVMGVAAGAAPSAHASTAALTSASCTVVTIYKGSTGALVKTLQSRLRGLTADGVFGNLTLAKVKAFQKSHGLTVDGVVGPKTWTALGGFPGCTGGGSSTTVVTKQVVSGIDFLSVRTGPGTGYTRVAKLSPGTKVTGIINNGWLKITSGSYAGKYVSAAYLIDVPKVDPNPPVSTVKGWIATTGGITASVRSGPGFDYGVVAHKSSGAAVSGTQVSTDWVKISGGYINRGEIETTSATLTKVNAQIPTSQLCAVNKAYNSPNSFDPGYTVNTTRYINCSAGRALDSLQAAYKAKFGHYANIDLAYRDWAEQQYWYNKLGPAQANKPGTSNHGMGLAVDFQEWHGHTTEFDWGGVGSNWLRANGGKYGFTQPYAYGTTGESYHFNFTG